MALGLCRAPWLFNENREIDGCQFRCLVKSAGVGATRLGSTDGIACQQVQANRFETRDTSGDIGC